MLRASELRRRVRPVKPLYLFDFKGRYGNKHTFLNKLPTGYNKCPGSKTFVNEDKKGLSLGSRLGFFYGFKIFKFELTFDKVFSDVR